MILYYNDSNIIIITSIIFNLSTNFYYSKLLAKKLFIYLFISLICLILNIKKVLII